MIFASERKPFCKNNQRSDKTRIELLKQIKTNFDIQSNLPSDFAGVPVLYSGNAWFMADEQGEQMNTYWSLFEAAIKYADGDSTIENTVELY